MKRKISSIISVSIISLSLIAIAIGATMIKKVTIIDFDHANKFENFSDPVLNKEEAITSGGG
jgi:O-glycosyl hydrolase